MASFFRTIVSLRSIVRGMAIQFLGDFLGGVTVQLHFDDQPQRRIVSELIEPLPVGFGLDDRLEWTGCGVRDLFESAPTRRRRTKAACVEDPAAPPDLPAQVACLGSRLVPGDLDEHLPQIATVGDVEILAARETRAGLRGIPSTPHPPRRPPIARLAAS